MRNARNGSSMRHGDRLPLATATCVSGLGLGFHTVREFGWAGLLAPDTGFLPAVAIQLALLGWWSVRGGRAAATWLTATGIFLLVGGAILSVLPLPILPFVPAQTIDHYVSHVVLGLTQMPLIVIGLRARATSPAVD